MVTGVDIETTLDRMNFSSRFAYHKTTERGRQILLQLWQPNPIVTQRCGNSGFRIKIPLPGAPGKYKTIQLAGKETIMQQIAWDSSRTPVVAKKKRGSTSEVIFDDGRAYFGRDGGRQRGIDVSREIEDYVRCNKSEFAGLHPKVDPYTKETFCCLVALKLRWIDAERVVYHSGYRIGTAIDILCLDERGELVLIEVKTGYDGVFCSARTMMRGNFQTLPDSPVNRAKMQGLFGDILMEAAYGIKAVACYVIQVVGLPPTVTNGVLDEARAASYVYDASDVIQYRALVKDSIACLRAD